MRPLILAALALSLAACNTPPTIVAQSEQSVVFVRQGRHTLQEAFTAADEYCRARGKPSRYRSTQRTGDWTVMDYFDCATTP